MERHLTDQELQDYLDGNLSLEMNFLVQHLKACERCQQQLKQYQWLYVELKKEPDFHIPSRLSHLVIAKIQTKSEKKSRTKYTLVPIIALLIALGTMLYLLDAFSWMSLVSLELNKLKIDLFNPIKNYLMGLNLNFVLLGYASVILLIIIFIDRLIFAPRLIRQWGRSGPGPL